MTFCLQSVTERCQWRTHDAAFTSATARSPINHRARHRTASRPQALFSSENTRSDVTLTSLKQIAAQHAAGTALTRRQLLSSGCIGLFLLTKESYRSAEAAEGSPSNDGSNISSSEQTFQPYINSQQQYVLSIPSSWEKVDKAGADVLFIDPSMRSTSVGVTVSPVRITSIEQFGDLATVGQRLLQAEARKESTLDVQLLSSSSRTGGAGATLYSYEYELNSTRGRKRILNTVTITGSKLYILNATLKCSKDAGCSAAQAIAVLKRAADSFDVGTEQLLQL